MCVCVFLLTVRKRVWPVFWIFLWLPQFLGHHPQSSTPKISSGFNEMDLPWGLHHEIYLLNDPNLYEESKTN